jgi:hypothetical protein
MPVADRWEDGDEQVPGVDPTDTVNWPLCAYAAREGRGIMNRYPLRLIALAIGATMIPAAYGLAELPGSSVAAHPIGGDRHARCRASRTPTLARVAHRLPDRRRVCRQLVVPCAA